MRQISENLFVHEDICMVYLVKSGSQGILIDFGSGDVLQHLEGTGVQHITDILMTHHHRDQGQGLPLAVSAGIRIWVPHTEQELFYQADAHWQSRNIYNNYNVRQDRFSLLESVAITGTLKDYSVHHFGQHAFTVVPTPGHTVGSLTLTAEIDGCLCAFCGDLIAGPGKVWSMAATQWSYNGAEGAPATIASLLDLKDRNIQQLLPSHGTIMDNPGEAIDLLVNRLWELLQLRKQNLRLFQLREKPFEQITPHLLMSRSSMANYYVLLSESGKALLFDFGYDFLTGIPAGADRASRRPWLYNINKLKREYSLHKIDVVLPTHYHDDHVAGCNLLRDIEGTQVWAAESFADILQSPNKYDLPCLWYDPIPVDQVIPLGTKIHWEEFEFILCELPGHTLYAVAIFLEVDGKRVLIAGDQQQGDEGLLWNYVYQNRFRIHDYRDSARLYKKLQPDVILTGHWQPLWVKTGYFEQLEEMGLALERLHQELLPLEDVNFGAEGFGARIEPYQLETYAGETVEVKAWIRNPFANEQDAVVQLVLPEGWGSDNLMSQKQHLRIEAGCTTVCEFKIAIPHAIHVRRARIAVDLTIGGRRFGQQAEALITVSSCAT